ncbi:glucuronyl hydrolase [Bacteroides nordii]|nr:glucuronyl hydrolase [Bacteroides nordii]
MLKDNFDFASGQLNFAFSEIDQVKSAFTEEQKEKMLVSPRNIEPDGSLRLVASRDWCSGFFPGELWYMYEYTGNEYWRQKAEEFTAPIEREKTNGRTHDMGFKMFCSFGNGYRLTHNSDYKGILIESAETLITRYKPNVGCIRSWDHNKDKWQCPVIIDNMMNLELLFWAYKQTNREEFYDIAVNHARTTMKNHFRDDYSSYHVIDYDTISGEVLKKNTHQGYAHESAWSRGQAWGLYGYTMCYRETNLPEFLEQAKHIANYIFTSKTLPEDLIPYWDFNAPTIPDEPRDVSAAAVIACALYELSMYDKDYAVKYKEWADTIVNNLSQNYRAALNGDRGFLLLHSTGSAPHKSEIDVPIVYADYYFLEALLRKSKLEKEGNAVL